MSIYTYKNLYRAYLDCRIHKRKTVSALEFEMDLESQLKKLLDELKSGAYRPGRSICFIVTEPCPREIFAAGFRDRVVHHLLVRELSRRAERAFVRDSFACRPGKGTHAAVRQAYELSRRVSANFRRDFWQMKIDISSFFMSIDKDILYAAALDLIDRHRKPDAWKLEAAELAGIIIFHRPQDDYARKGDPELKQLVPPHKSLLGQTGDQGLPIGNYSSQFFANLYMNKLDHFIKRDLCCRHYVRYVDDMIFFARDKERLRHILDRVRVFLEKRLALRVNAKKTVIEPARRGLDLFGYNLKQYRISARRSVSRRYKAKLFPAAIGKAEIPWPRSRAIAASYLGHCGHFGN